MRNMEHKAICKRSTADMDIRLVKNNITNLDTQPSKNINSTSMATNNHRHHYT